MQLISASSLQERIMPDVPEQEEQQNDDAELSPHMLELLEEERIKREIAEEAWRQSDLEKGIPHVGLAGGQPRKMSNPPPLEIPPEERIAFLQACLDGADGLNGNWSPDQRANLKLLIEAYSKGELGPMTTYPKHSIAAACNGRIFDHHPTEEERDGHEVWTEEFKYQMMQSAEDQRPRLQQMRASSHHMRTWSAYELGTESCMHEFVVEMRLCVLPEHLKDWYQLPNGGRTLGRGGPDELTTKIEVHNDTGSNLLTVFDKDLRSLGVNEDTYWAMGPYNTINLAAGHSARFRTLTVEIRVLDKDGHAMTGWFPEEGMLVKHQQGMVRLSGLRVRHELYFVTNKSNILYTGRSKNAVFQVTDTNWKGK